jgi:hypothetical protein
MNLLRHTWFPITLTLRLVAFDKFGRLRIYHPQTPREELAMGALDKGSDAPKAIQNSMPAREDDEDEGIIATRTQPWQGLQEIDVPEDIDPIYIRGNSMSPNFPRKHPKILSPASNVKSENGQTWYQGPRQNTCH